MPAYEPGNRKFTLTHPIHTDLFGGIVKIIHTNSPMVLRGRVQPVLGLRWQPGLDSDVTEEHYSLNGEWDMEGNPNRMDLWDADLDTIKPLQRVRLESVK